MFPVMLLSTVLGALFAFCGLMGGVAFFLEAQQGMSMSAFLQGFAAATWPLIAACALFLLQGILKEVSALCEQAEDEKDAPGIAPLPRKSTAPMAPEAEWTSAAAPAAKPAPVEPNTPVYFPVRETPLGPRILRLQSKAAAAEDAPEAPEKNAETAAATEPQPEQESPAEQVAEEASEAAVAEPKDDGRTFFKTR